MKPTRRSSATNSRSRGGGVLRRRAKGRDHRAGHVRCWQRRGRRRDRRWRPISYYSNGDGLRDMCTGPHVPSTVSVQAQSVAGAYWRGDHPSDAAAHLRRRGPTKALKTHLQMLAEAEHDHRRLPPSSTSCRGPTNSVPDSPCGTPRGALIRKIMRTTCATVENGGYEFVFSRISRSRCWDLRPPRFYADGMYRPWRWMARRTTRSR